MLAIVAPFPEEGNRRQETRLFVALLFPPSPPSPLLPQHFACRRKLFGRWSSGGGRAAAYSKQQYLCSRHSESTLERERQPLFEEGATTTSFVVSDDDSIKGLFSINRISTSAAISTPARLLYPCAQGRPCKGQQ